MSILRISEAAFLACAVFFLMLVGPASAHHSRAGIYDVDAQLEMEGVVTQWRWTNPHTYLVWESADEDGKMVEWVGELSSVTSMISEGLTRNSFPAGEKVTVVVSPATSGAPQGQLLKVVMADGRVPLDRSSDVD
jgi:hypothetical protein